MLKHIHDFAQQKELSGDSKYREKYIKFHIVIDSEGNLISIEENTDKKNKTLCPSYPNRILNGNTSNFLVTSGQIMFDINNKKHESYLNDLRECSKQSSEINSVLKFVENASKNDFIEGIFDEELKNTFVLVAEEKLPISFRIDGMYVEKSASWKPYFENRFQEFVDADAEENANNPKMISVVSGNLIIPIEKTDKLLVPGATSSTGDILICCDKSAFKSYGLEGALNGAISKEESETIKLGMEYLLSNNYNRDWNLIHWYKFNPKFDFVKFHLSPRRIIIPGISDVENFDQMSEEKKDSILYEFLQKLAKGQLVRNNSNLEDNEYYLLNYKPCSGRIAFSNFKIGNFNELIENLEKFYKDSEMLSVWKDKDSGLQQKSITPILNIYSIFLNLLNAEAKKDSKYEKVNDEFGIHKKQQLFEIIFYNKQVPIDFVNRALNRIRKDKMNGDRTNQVVYKLLKVYINRSNTKEDDVILPALNKENKDIAYNLGRMLSVYQKIQGEAMKDVKTTIVDRYYSAASSAPMYVYETLARLNNYYLNKLTPQRAIYFKRLLQEIASNIDAYPATLGIRERANFSLGYYQQEQALYTKNSENNLEEDNNV